MSTMNLRAQPFLCFSPCICGINIACFVPRFLSAAIPAFLQTSFQRYFSDNVWQHFAGVSFCHGFLRAIQWGNAVRFVTGFLLSTIPRFLQSSPRRSFSDVWQNFSSVNFCCIFHVFVGFRGEILCILFQGYFQQLFPDFLQSSPRNFFRQCVAYTFGCKLVFSLSGSASPLLFSSPTRESP